MSPKPRRGIGAGRGPGGRRFRPPRLRRPGLFRRPRPGAIDGGGSGFCLLPVIGIAALLLLVAF